MGTPEIVVNCARLCSSRFTPVGAPIGFSGAFSREGRSVFSAQRFSESDGWRLSVTSEIGLSETVGRFFSAISTLMIGDALMAGKQGKRPLGRQSQRPNHEGHPSCLEPFARAPTLSHTSTKRKRHDIGAAAIPPGRRGILVERRSCRRTCASRARRYSED